MTGISNGPRMMQVSHSVDFDLYRAMVAFPKSYKIHRVPKAALFPVTLILLKAITFYGGQGKNKKKSFQGQISLRTF